MPNIPDPAPSLAQTVRDGLTDDQRGVLNTIIDADAAWTEERVFAGSPALATAIAELISLGLVERWEKTKSGVKMEGAPFLVLTTWGTAVMGVHVQDQVRRIEVDIKGRTQTYKAKRKYCVFRYRTAPLEGQPVVAPDGSVRTLTSLAEIQRRDFIEPPSRAPGWGHLEFPEEVPDWVPPPLEVLIDLETGEEVRLFQGPDDRRSQRAEGIPIIIDKRLVRNARKKAKGATKKAKKGKRSRKRKTA